MPRGLTEWPPLELPGSRNGVRFSLVLAHLSETNNSPARASGTVRKALRKAGYGGVSVLVAIAGHPTPWIEVGQPVETKAYVYRYGSGEEDAARRLFDVE